MQKRAPAKSVRLASTTGHYRTSPSVVKPVWQCRGQLDLFGRIYQCKTLNGGKR
jgi:hypothetical protein